MLPLTIKVENYYVIEMLANRKTFFFDFTTGQINFDYFTHIDTGALYRGVAVVAIRNGASIQEEVAVASIASKAKFEFRSSPEGNLLFIDGIDSSVHFSLRSRFFPLIPTL